VRPVASRNTSSSVGSLERPARSRRSAFSCEGVPSRRSGRVDDREPVAQLVGLLEVLRGEEDGRPRALIRRTSSQIVRRLAGSRPVVGSSRNSTSGWCTSAEARIEPALHAAE
jgi:hypothetical protein